MQTESQQKTGLKCPVCGAFISTTISQLITAEALSCPFCGLKLDIDREASRNAIQALTKIQNAQQLVEEKSHFNY